MNFGCGTFRLFLSLTPLDGRYPLGLESNTAYYEQLLLSYKQTIQSQIAPSKKRKKNLSEHDDDDDDTKLAVL